MKKRAALILGLTLLGAALLAGCGSKDAADQNGSVKDEGTGAGETGTTEKGYVFEISGVRIAVDMDMSVIAEKLGDPDSYYEEPSCAAEGIAKIYTYSSFEIDTYPDGDKDLIACIILKDDNVATAEGIDLSKSKEDIISAYGSDYEETDRSLVYEKDGMKLCFIFNGDDIASIEYDSSALN